jgi:hypothetical protein
MTDSRKPDKFRYEDGKWFINGQEVTEAEIRERVGHNTYLDGEQVTQDKFIEHLRQIPNE